MQKKKCLLRFLVLVIFLVGVLGGGLKAKAANTECFCGNGSTLSFTYVGTMVNLPSDGDCDKECAKRGANIYCYNGPCVVMSNVTTPALKQACLKMDGTCDPCLADMSNCNLDCTAASLDGVPCCPNIVDSSSDKCKTLKTGLRWCCDDTAAKNCYDIEENKDCVDNMTTNRYKEVCENVDTCKAYASNSANNNTNNNNTSTNNSSGTPTSTEFINPIKFDTIDGVLTSLLTALSGLVVTLAIIFIVLGGILYMVSAGDPGMIKRAKDCWLFSVIGLAIVVAAPTFLKEVQTILGGSVTDSTGKIASAPTVAVIATNVLNFLLSIVGIIAIISLVIAGGMYMTAYGDDTRIGTAKKMGTYAIVGIVVALVSLIAVQQVSKLITG